MSALAAVLDDTTRLDLGSLIRRRIFPPVSLSNLVPVDELDITTNTVSVLIVAHHVVGWYVLCLLPCICLVDTDILVASRI